MKKLALLGSLALCGPVVAFAQSGTCSDPIPLESNNSVAGSTCGGQVGIDMGGTVYGHPSVVYSFRINHDGPDGSPLGAITLAGTNMEAAVTSSCSTAPFAGATGDGGLTVNAESIADGEYLLVVSTDPSIPPQPAPGVCGDFSVTAGTLPVTLQDFSVE